VLVVTRIIAYAAAVIGATAYVPIVDRYFEAGIWQLLGWYAVAGVALGARAMPIGRQLDDLDRGGLDEVARPRIRPSVIDLIVVLALSLVGGYLAVATYGGDSYLPVLMLFPLAIAVGVGIVVGMVVITPLGMLAGAAARGIAGKPVGGYLVGVALILLTVAGFAVVGSFALDGTPTGLTYRGRAWQGIFVVLTGIPLGDLAVGSQPLAWVARGLAALIVAEVAVVVRSGLAARRSRRSED